MPLRPPSFAGLVDLVSRRVDVDFRVVTTIGLELAHSFLLLHNEGLCYRDISFGNVFFDPASGHVRICDIDNVGIDGASTSNVKGTPYFMAPEIVRGEALPSRNTDLFSLSVLLFYLLMIHHPLEGRRALEHQCWNKDAMDDLFGHRPLFIFDPADTANEPVPGHHDNPLVYWPLYPSFVRDAFTEAFTAGLRDPIDGRVRESVWRSVLSRLRDLIVYCQACRAQSFLDPDQGVPSCWSCGAAVLCPPVLDFGWTTLVLNHDSRVFAHHVRRDYDFDAAVAEVRPHPERHGVWGITNTSPKAWSVTMSDGREKEVAPERSIVIAPGMRIDFGRSGASATVREVPRSRAHGGAGETWSEF
jgi:hypothetical protein